MTLAYHIHGLYTDRYQLEMALAYWQEGRREEKACFDYFFRKNPFGGAFTVFAGLDTLLKAVQAFRFPQPTLAYLEACGFPGKFLKYLVDFRFKGRIYAMREGEIVFPLEPLLRVEGNLIETQVIETLILNVLNFQSLIATKAARCCRLAGDRAVSEFGLRRAQGLGGIWGSRAAVIGGCASTSNLEAGRLYDLPIVGTMSHSFVQSYGDELEAFRAFARVHCSNTVLLLDTYDTLRSGIPNAIRVAQEMAQRGDTLRGVRLDSGDLAYMSAMARRQLDEAGFDQVAVVVSNQIDEWIIRSLNEQGAAIDIFGVGTKLAVGHPDAALDGVCKLSLVNGQPRMKLSDTRIKATLPGRKTVTRFKDGKGRFKADAIHLATEDIPDRMIHPYEPKKQMSLQDLTPEPLLTQVLDGDAVMNPARSVQEIASHVRKRIGQLPGEHLRLENPHTYRVGISPGLDQLRNDLSEKLLEKDRP